MGYLTWLNRSKRISSYGIYVERNCRNSREGDLTAGKGFARNAGEDWPRSTRFIRRFRSERAPAATNLAERPQPGVIRSGLVLRAPSTWRAGLALLMFYLGSLFLADFFWDIFIVSFVCLSLVHSVFFFLRCLSTFLRSCFFYASSNIQLDIRGFYYRLSQL